MPSPVRNVRRRWRARRPTTAVHPSAHEKQLFSRAGVGHESPQMTCGCSICAAWVRRYSPPPRYRECACRADDFMRQIYMPRTID